MARTSKPWSTEDRVAVEYLAELIEAARISGREVARRAGLQESRLGRILRGEGAPLTIGEMGSIGATVGLRASDVMREVENRVAASTPKPTLMPSARPSEDDEPDALITPNPAAADPAEGYDPDAEVEAQQDQS